VASKIKIKRSSVAGKTPTTSDIDVGELAINTKDQKLYSSNGTAVFQIGASGGGGAVSITTATVKNLTQNDTVVTNVTSYANSVVDNSLLANYQTIAVERAALANTNAYIASKVSTSTFNSALANTNSYIASKASWSALTSTNTAIRTLVSDRLQVTNAAATYATKASPTTSGVLAHTGRATISTNLDVSGNASVTGTMTATGIVSGLELVSTNASGDEGGEIKLTKPPNGTLSGGVTIDAYQNRIRFFEQGGSARGAYIDLSACVGGAGTNLLAGGGSSSNAFSGILVGANVISADSTSDRLTLVAGSNITLAANPTTDTITISSTASGGITTGKAIAMAIVFGG